jgi:hypothetical protein
MCVPNHLRDPRTRWMMILGNFSLVVALLLWTFARPCAGTHSWPIQPWIDGVSGLLFGISIGANLSAIRCARSRQATASVQQ